jgi:ATP-binding cassette subfamily F protein uup
MNRLGGKVVELKKIYKKYGEKQVIKGFDYTFRRGERVGVIGKNGVGKSTLLNIIQQIIPADSGKINVGETVVFGNFSQQGLDIKENVRVIEYVKSFAENFPLAKGGSLSASQFLELFLFPAEKQYTYLESLSGGEKKRLQLLTVLFRNPNFLILDEPTNDLDLPTLLVLERFLIDYQGCLLIVSHDRYFMDKLVEHLFVFEGDGVISDFPGNYTQYRFSQKEKEQTKKQNAQQKEEKNTIGKQEINPIKKKAGFKEKREFELLEKEIADLENEKSVLANELSNPDFDHESLRVKSVRIGEIAALLNEKEIRWLELSELME